jgi:DNA-directed RNA polymerase sigma subunit (sigma70/sigma32)
MQVTQKRKTAVQTPMETYLREINQTSLLTANQEKELAYRIPDSRVHGRVALQMAKDDCSVTGRVG